MYSKTLLVFLVVYFLCDFSRGQIDEHFFRKDYTYLETLEGFYKLHVERMPWDYALRECALEKASLFYPENDDEAQAVISFWNKTQPKTSEVYLAMSKSSVTQLFETTDGKTIFEVYNNWSPGQPDEVTSVDLCVVLNKNGYLDDVRCHYSKPFICKKSLQSVEWNYNCNMSNLDYTFNENLGKCYKLHTTPLNWRDAYLACRAEQSYLAVIDTPVEAEYFVNLTESALNHVVQESNTYENYQRGIYHLGFHKNKEGWWTDKGNRVNDASFWWGNHLPDKDDVKKCGSMFYTGRLNNINCDTKSFFICEHDVNVIIDIRHR